MSGKFGLWTTDFRRLEVVNVSPVFAGSGRIARWPAVAGVATAALAGVCGCGTSVVPGPHALPAVTALADAPSPGVAPSDAGPTGERRAVAAVVRRYYRVLNRLRRRMDPAPLAALLTPDCACRAQVRAVRRAMHRNERYVERVRIRSLTVHLDAPGVADVAVTFDAGRGGLVTSAGRFLHRVPAASGLHRQFLLQRRRGRWLIANVVVV